MKKPPKVKETEYLPLSEEDVPMDEVDMLFESNLIERESSDAALEDAILAWKYAVAHKDKIDVPYILEIHRLLMQRLEPEIAGKIRDCDVWIGGHKKMFISVALLKEQLEQWIKESGDAIASIMATDFTDPEAELENRESIAKNAHIAFEGVHPHIDGNGRCGRILYQVHRLLLGLPIKTIESSTKYESYYPWFKEAESS